VPQKRGANTDPDVRHAIEELARAGYKSPAIQTKLRDDKRLRDRVPESLRTIQAIAATAKRSAGELWYFDRSVLDPAGPLTVLAEVIALSHGRVADLTEAEAAAAAHVYRAAPDIPPGEARRLTWMLVPAVQVVADDVDPGLLDRLVGQQHQAAEQFLAFAPWRSPEHAARYEAAWQSGWIDGYVWPGEFLYTVRSREESVELRTAAEKGI
jgi:hypothetical protein